MNPDAWTDELDQIIALNSPRIAPPNSYTIDQWLDRVEEKTGERLSPSVGRTRLNEGVKQGKLATDLRYVKGRERRVFWLVRDVSQGQD